MNVERVMRHIEVEAIAQDTLDFLKIPSETGEEAAGCRFFANLLQREGFEPTFDEPAPNRPNIYARIGGARPNGGRSLLLNGHIDTIPIGVSTPAGREGDWLVGRGAEDMKSGLVAMVHGASALRKAGLSLAGDLWLTGVVGHEVGKEGPRRLIEHLRSGRIRPDAILICEGPPAAWVSSLGTTIFTLTMTSDLGPIQTSRVPYARNPARWLGELLVRFQELEESFVASPPHPLSGREQLNTGIVQGGDYYNRLPTPITVSGQWRYKPDRTFADVQVDLEALCDEISARSGLRFEGEFEGARDAFEIPADDPIVQAVLVAGEQVSGEPPDVIGRPVVGDANLYVNEGGVTSIYYGPAAHGTAHSDDERVQVEMIAHCARAYAVTAMRYCGIAP